MNIRQNVSTLKQYVHSYYWDIRRYTRWSGVSNNSAATVIEARILKEFHRIEKGISLPQPREWFGRETIERIVGLCRAYVALDESDQTVVRDALETLTSYSKTFETAPPEWWLEIEPEIEGLSRELGAGSPGRGGRTPVGAVVEGWATDIPQFIRSRRSIRDYAEKSVPQETLDQAVSDARFSPSVCNRQAIRVRFFPRGDAADQLLRLQNGNRGFGHTASHIALVTGDLSAFLTPGERNQVFVDGGLFSMTLINSLWSKGVGTCCLNWSVTAKQDNQLRRTINLPQNEVVIMMIAVGYPASAAFAANSPRLGLERVLRIGPADD
ncbi:nitroreductase family protein [Rhodococcus pyridinivorans]|uniref:nitroreductase family protein n=1 Tax=Rhodococcus TaxID=1827 RepID=UPI0009F9F8A7|nr:MULTISPECIES: nitroreductase family protein [Rhodococcus]UPK65825.1 nitroreductase family protein [Rhodococcus pyridinivorans]